MGRVTNHRPSLDDVFRRMMRSFAMVIASALVAGLVWTLAAPEAAPPRTLLLAAVLLLLVFPLGNVILAFAAETRRREWAFAAAAAAALAILLAQFWGAARALMG
jgi:hypothetical protein